MLLTLIITVFADCNFSLCSIIPKCGTGFVLKQCQEARSTQIHADSVYAVFPSDSIYKEHVNVIRRTQRKVHEDNGSRVQMLLFWSKAAQNVAEPLTQITVHTIKSDPQLKTL